MSTKTSAAGELARRLFHTDRDFRQLVSVLRDLGDRFNRALLMDAVILADESIAEEHARRAESIAEEHARRAEQQRHRAYGEMVMASTKAVLERKAAEIRAMDGMRGPVISDEPVKVPAPAPPPASGGTRAESAGPGW